jgi:adenylate cyclase
MMAADEVATLTKLRRYRKIMGDLFDGHEGRQVNTWGDSVIGEFSSVVEAVRCAVEIQDAIGAENRDLPDNQQMRFRIGINLGDVMDDDGDLYGDGVNIAARLEALSEPGGIMVSENVYKLSHKQLAFGYDFAGKQAVKDGEEPIAGYRVRVGGDNHPDYPNRQAPKQQAGEDLGESAHLSADATQNPNSRIRRIFTRAGKLLDTFLDWYPRQSGKIKFSVFAIGFFAAINILFSGIATPWFIFPAAPFALYILLKMRKRD